MSKISNAKFRELSQNFPKLADWAVHWVIGRSLRLAALGAGTFKQGTILLNNPVKLIVKYHDASLTLSLEGDGEGVLAVGVAHRAVVLPEVGGDDVPDHQRAAHAVGAPALLHPVVTARRSGHLDRISLVRVFIYP